MGDTTEIAWTDHTMNPWSLVRANAALSVLCLMAWPAQSNAIGDGASKIGIVSKRLDMMCLKVASARILAMLTGKFVAEEDVVTPSLIFSGKSLSSTLHKFSILVGWALWSATRGGTNAMAYLGARFWRVRFPLHVARKALVRGAQLGLRVCGVTATLEGRNAALSVFALFDASTSLAGGAKAVATRPVSAKLVTNAPCLALGAALQSGQDHGLIFENGHARIFGGSLSCSNHGLRHAPSISQGACSWV